MICESCRGRGFVPLLSDADDDETKVEPCPDCLAGRELSAERERAEARRDGRQRTLFDGPTEAEIERSQQRIAAILGADPYRDEGFLERPCDHCGKPYQGPAVYCSLECALDDA